MKYRKQRIPTKVREEIWLRTYGEVFSAKCSVCWCTNRYKILSSEWHVGHNIPEVNGGSNRLQNLVPICSSCNLGMGARFSFDEWCDEYSEEKKIRLIDSANALLSLSKTKKRKRV